MITPKKGQIVNFLQTYTNKGKPKIEIYLLNEFPNIPDRKEVVGYGNLSIDKDNLVHMYPGKEGKINFEHFNKYKESRKRSLLKLMIY
jgi:hypothetical protein